MDDSAQTDYDKNTVDVKCRNESFILKNDVGWFPIKHDPYKVHNIGRKEVQVELWYGNQVHWFGVACKTTIAPGESKIIDDDTTHYVTGIKILNNYDTRAIVHGKGGVSQSDFTPNDKFYLYKVLQETLTLSIKYFTGRDISCIFVLFTTLFWPEDKPEIWTEISDKVKSLLDDRTRSIIISLLINKMKRYKARIKSLTRRIHDKSVMQHAYMSLARELIGLEYEFCFPDDITNHENINFYILPLYSNIISMKFNFYMLGVIYKTDFGLSEEDVEVIKSYASEIFHNASKHIKDLASSVIDSTYNDAPAQGIFNSMMMSRSHSAIHGLEYIPIWEHILKYPDSNQEIDNHVMSYSTFFGKPTADLYALATPVDVPPPLCPKLINNKRDVLKKIVIYIWPTNLHTLQIAGATLFFENDDQYNIGTCTAYKEVVELSNVKILRLKAYGEGQIDGLKFYLTNGDIKEVGQVHSNCNETFELQDHFIASIYMSGNVAGPAHNIAVSYRWLVKSRKTPSSQVQCTLETDRHSEVFSIYIMAIVLLMFSISLDFFRFLEVWIPEYYFHMPLLE